MEENFSYGTVENKIANMFVRWSWHGSPVFYDCCVSDTLADIIVGRHDSRLTSQCLDLRQNLVLLQHFHLGRETPWRPDNDTNTLQCSLGHSILTDRVQLQHDMTMTQTYHNVVSGTIIVCFNIIMSNLLNNVGCLNARTMIGVQLSLQRIIISPAATDRQHSHWVTLAYFFSKCILQDIN